MILHLRNLSSKNLCCEIYDIQSTPSKALDLRILYDQKYRYNFHSGVVSMLLPFLNYLLVLPAEANFLPFFLIQNYFGKLTPILHLMGDYNGMHLLQYLRIVSLDQGINGKHPSGIQRSYNYQDRDLPLNPSKL